MRTAVTEPHELIPPREALKILTFVSASGLAIGSYQTNELTRFPCGKGTLYSRQECEALRDSIIEKGKPKQLRFPKRERSRRPIITELI